MPARSTLKTHPAQPFFSTMQQRLALARQRFFDEGQRPTGLVSEAVIQSWARCVHWRRNPRERLEFEPVTRSRVGLSLSKHRELLGAAAAPLSELEGVLARTGCWALLADATGVVLNVGRKRAASGESIMPVLGRVGVNVAETVLGTNAPGITARTGQICTVLGSEHYFDVVQPLSCTAAPVRDASGHVAAVLDLSMEGRPFGFDAEALVAQYATAIENRWLLAQARDQLVLRFHTTAALLGSPCEALAGIDTQGRVAWTNELAWRWLGSRSGTLESLFGLAGEALSRLLGCDAPRLVHLSNGLAVWARAEMRTRDGARKVHAVGSSMPADAQAAPVCAQGEPVAVAAPVPAPTLGALGRQHIDKVLADLGGNISSAARALGVSRGLIYRHLQGRRADSDETTGAAAGPGAA